MGPIGWVLFSAENLQYLWNGARQDQGCYWWLIGSYTRAFDDWYRNQWSWMTFNGHYALCFKIHAFSEPTTKIWMKIGPYYQGRRCSPMTLDCDNIRFMRIFAVFSRLCKFSLDFMPASLYYVFRKRHAVIVFNFKCLFMTVSYQYGCLKIVSEEIGSYQYGCRVIWSAWLAEMWDAE